MIKAILFDFDGTLVDTLPFYLKAYDKALKKFGINFSDKKIVNNCFGKKEEEICQSLKIKDVNAFRQTYFQGVKLFKDIKFFPGALDFINFARQKQIKLAIVTFAYKWYINKITKKLNIKNLFDIILSTDDVENPKPHPEMVFKASRVFNISPSSTLVIGDSKGDMFMAKAAGAKSALFLPEKHKLFYDFNELKKTNPDFTFSKFEELKKKIADFITPGSLN